MPQVECDVCGAVFHKRSYQLKISKHNYCSKKCISIGKSIYNSGENHPCWKGTEPVGVVCEICGVISYKPPSKVGKSAHSYCSVRCKDVGKSRFFSGENHPGWKDVNGVEVECEMCGTIILRAPSKIKKNEHNYCSRECMSAGRSVFNSGENSPHWKGGVTPVSHSARMTAGYKSWRSSVFERDSYTCHYCGVVGGELESHHIMSFSRFPDLRLHVSNGVTLCKMCHRDFHSTYGNKDFTSDDFYEWENREDLDGST